MSMSNYEAAVYMEDCIDLIEDILAAIKPIDDIPDYNIQVALLSAAFITVAQAADGHDMNKPRKVMLRNGVVDRMKLCIDMLKVVDHL